MVNRSVIFILILYLTLRFYISLYVIKTCFCLGIPVALRLMSSLCLYFFQTPPILQLIHCIFRYVESAQTLGKETNIDLNKYEVCDNVDLSTVLMEYESYYYIKFARYPKITKKLTQSGKLLLIFGNFFM